MWINAPVWSFPPHSEYIYIYVCVYHNSKEPLCLYLSVCVFKHQDGDSGTLIALAKANHKQIVATIHLLKSNNQREINLFLTLFIIQILLVLCICACSYTIFGGNPFQSIRLGEEGEKPKKESDGSAVVNMLVDALYAKTLTTTSTTTRRPTFDVGILIIPPHISCLEQHTVRTYALWRVYSILIPFIFDIYTYGVVSHWLSKKKRNKINYKISNVVVLFVQTVI